MVPLLVRTVAATEAVTIRNSGLARVLEADQLTRTLTQSVNYLG